MNLRQMVMFRAIVEHKNISLAAKHLYISQSALSQQISALEDELGCAILLRSAKGVQPTAAGMVLYRNAVDIIEKFSAAEAEVRMADSVVSGTIAVGTIASDISLALRCMQSFSALYPHVRFRIFPMLPSDIEDGLESRKLDVGFLRELWKHRENFDSVCMKDEQMVVAVPSHMDPCPSQDTISIEQLKQLPYCKGIDEKHREERNWDYGEILYKQCRQQGLDFDRVYECSGTLISLLLSCAGVAASLIPREMAELVNSRNIHIKRIKDAELLSHPTLVWNKNFSAGPHIGLFLQHAISTMNEE